MKKYFVVILMFLLVFALFAGCSKKAEENTERSTAAEKADAALLATALSSMTSFAVKCHYKDTSSQYFL